jgi:hypothetical protein
MAHNLESMIFRMRGIHESLVITTGAAYKMLVLHCLLLTSQTSIERKNGHVRRTLLHDTQAWVPGCRRTTSPNTTKNSLVLLV